MQVPRDSRKLVLSNIKKEARFMEKHTLVDLKAQKGKNNYRTRERLTLWMCSDAASCRKQKLELTKQTIHFKSKMLIEHFDSKSWIPKTELASRNCFPLDTAKIWHYTDTEQLDHNFWKTCSEDVHRGTTSPRVHWRTKSVARESGGKTEDAMFLPRNFGEFRVHIMSTIL